MTPSDLNVIIFADAYPSERASSGTGVSVRNLATSLIGAGVTVGVVVAGVDNGAGEERYDCWTEQESVRIWRCSRGVSWIVPLLREVRRWRLHSFYVNSIFHRRFSMLPLLLWRLRVLKARRGVIAPRGELFVDALSHRRLVKTVYLGLLRRTRIARRLSWHATSETERDRILATFRDDAIEVDVIANIPRQLARRGPLPGSPGPLRLLFSGRVTPIKNLLELLRAIQCCEADVELRIAGPISNAQYWELCLAEMSSGSSNSNVHYIGDLEFDALKQELHDSDLFVLPSLSENYGHSIVEALQVGVPVVIGSNTPWTSLIIDSNAGWVADPNDARELAHCIDAFDSMDIVERERMSNASAELGKYIARSDTIIAQFVDLLSR